MKRQCIVVLSALTAAGCAQPLDPEDIPDIDGTWTVTEAIDATGTSCRFVGTMDIRQDGEDFVGQFTRTGQCSIRDLQGTSAAAQTGSTTAGRVGLDTVDYRIADCDYRGVIMNDPPDQITGSIFCTAVLFSGGISTSAGTWHAERITDAKVPNA